MAFKLRKKTGVSSTLLLHLKHNYFKVSLVGLLLTLGCFHIKIALLEQFAYSGNTSRQFAHEQTNPNALYQLGLTAYLTQDNISLALGYFTKALSQFSLHIPSFIRKAELLAEQNKTEQARCISDYVDARAPNTYLWRWDRTMLAYSLDQFDLLAKNLSWFIENNHGKRNEALVLATSVWSEPMELILRIGAHNSLNLLGHYIKMQEVENAQYTWETILKNSLAEDSISLRYTNFLIKHKELQSAIESWKVYTKKTDDSLIYNANFRQEITEAGFGWRVNKKHRKLLNPLSESVSINFNGRENIKFNLHQLIPVIPGQTYSLSYSQKSEALSTDQRPFWLVNGYNCEKFIQKSDMVPENSDWTESSMIIQVPETCHGIWLRLYRKESFRFDNKISGKLHFRNLTLTPAATKSSTPFEQL